MTKVNEIQFRNILSRSGAEPDVLKSRIESNGHELDFDYKKFQKPQQTIYETKLESQGLFDKLKERNSAAFGAESGIISSLLNPSSTLQSDSAAGRFMRGEQGAAQTTFDIAGQGAGAIGDVIGAGIGTTLKGANLLSGGLLGKAGEAIVGSEVGQSVVRTAEDIASQYQTFKEKFPEAARNLESTVNIASILPVSFAPKVAGAIGPTLKKGASGIVKRVIPVGKSFDEAVAIGMEKGVKPKFMGAMRSSPIALQEYNKKASEAVAQILEHRPILSYVDDAGDVVSQGHAPSNLSEFTQAINQTKKSIFNQYSALSEQATGQGARVDLEDLADSLLTYSENPVKGLADSSKTAYARTMATKLMKKGDLSPKETEQLIAELNQSLAKAYADKAAKGVSEVDLSIANALREKLDQVILGATGEQYQTLKNSYGALKAIENDVGHRALVAARANVKGLIDMTDIFTGADLLAGVLTMNPAMVARGATGRGIKMLYKYMNSPDANVMRMFNRAQKAFKESSILPLTEGTQLPQRPQVPLQPSTQSALKGGEGITQSPIQPPPTQTVKEAIPKVESPKALPASRGIPKELEPLAAEARKGFQFSRNPEGSIKMSNDRFAQSIEPTGKYMTIFEKGEVKNPKWEYGTERFDNPLIIEWGSTGHGGWKTKLSEMFGGKTGKNLSKEITKAGYDGIITVDGATPREIVSLKDFYRLATKKK